MNIFVTGATGVLGKAIVPMLIADGHTVCALSRSKANKEILQYFGARPVQANLFDVTSLKRELFGCDAILHLATRIPPTSKIAKRSAWLENDRIRRDGTRNLVEAALAVATVQVFVYPSYAFVYPDSGDRWIDASTTPAQPITTAQSTLDAEEAVAQFSGEHRQGISLRLGSLYGPESASTYELLDYARKGIAAFPGHREAYLPQITVQDAARAMIAALMQPVPAGVYDVVDDEPLTRGEVFATMAQAVGRKHLLHPPALLMRVMMGVVYDVISRSLRVSNQRFKEVSDWQPIVPNARIGWGHIPDESRVAEPV